MKTIHYKNINNDIPLVLSEYLYTAEDWLTTKQVTSVFIIYTVCDFFKLLQLCSMIGPIETISISVNNKTKEIPVKSVH